ncbi:hypothetical protein CRUP_014895, partial [Coryphaenoides rupestris]
DKRSGERSFGGHSEVISCSIDGYVNFNGRDTRGRRYGIKKKEEKEAEAAAAMEQASEGSLTRPKKAVPHRPAGDERGGEGKASWNPGHEVSSPDPSMDMFSNKHSTRPGSPRYTSDCYRLETTIPAAFHLTPEPPNLKPYNLP